MREKERLNEIKRVRSIESEIERVRKNRES